MKTDSWRRNIGLRKWWKSSLDKRKSLWIVKGREVKQTDPQMIFRKLLLRSFSFLYKEGISPHESKESEAPCSPRNSQESSPTPHFKSINSSALSFLDSPTLTSLHGDGQGGLACCDSWGRKESDMTEQLN